MDKILYCWNGHIYLVFFSFLDTILDSYDGQDAAQLELMILYKWAGQNITGLSSLLCLVQFTAKSPGQDKFE